MSQLDKDRLKSNYAPKGPSNRSATVKTPHSSLQAEGEPEQYEKLHVFRCKYHPGQVVDKVGSSSTYVKLVMDTRI
jgi:hypothetical protein